MFGRRIVGSGAIPQHMFRQLHISTRQQANRLVPPLIPITSIFSSGLSQVQPLCNTGTLTGMNEGSSQLEGLDGSSSGLLNGMLSGGHLPAVQMMLNSLAPHPLLLRIISDMTMMSTYSRTMLTSQP
eukprot:gene12341-8469_t